MQNKIIDTGEKNAYRLIISGNRIKIKNIVNIFNGLKP